MILYINNGGEVTCAKTLHGGYYLAMLIQTRPDNRSYTTPRDHWMRVDEDLVEEYGLKCEACERESRFQTHHCVNCGHAPHEHDETSEAPCMIEGCNCEMLHYLCGCQCTHEGICDREVAS